MGISVLVGHAVNDEEMNLVLRMSIYVQSEGYTLLALPPDGSL